MPKMRQHKSKRRILRILLHASLWLSKWLFIFLILMTEEELLKKLDTAGSEAQHELEKGTVYF